MTDSLRLAGRQQQEDSVIVVGGCTFGRQHIPIIAGPCAVEDDQSYLATAEALTALGVDMLRGGTFKPRTSPYAFQGTGNLGLEVLRQARELTGLPVVTEVLDVREVEYVAQYVDMLQIGTRNMHNTALLKEVGQSRHPVLLKRGFAATVHEWLLAAEYILSEGNTQVVLCERGIRTFDTSNRYTLDLAAVALAQQLSHLPVIVDPSHATGNWRLVSPMSLAAVAGGADALLIEVHPDPVRALCDGGQSLTLESFTKLIGQLSPVATAVGRSIGK